MNKLQYRLNKLGKELVISLIYLIKKDEGEKIDYDLIETNLKNFNITKLLIETKFKEILDILFKKPESENTELI